MKRIRKILAVPLLGMIMLLMACGAMVGSVLFRLMSLVVSLTGICMIWAWLIGDKMAPLFSGIFVGFMILMLIGVFLQEQGEAMISKLSKLAKTH